MTQKERAKIGSKKSNAGKPKSGLFRHFFAVFVWVTQKARNIGKKLMHFWFVPKKTQFNFSRKKMTRGGLLKRKVTNRLQWKPSGRLRKADTQLNGRGQRDTLNQIGNPFSPWRILARTKTLSRTAKAVFLFVGNRLANESQARFPHDKKMNPWQCFFCVLLLANKERRG